MVLLDISEACSLLIHNCLLSIMVGTLWKGKIGKIVLTLVFLSAAEVLTLDTNQHFGLHSLVLVVVTVLCVIIGYLVASQVLPTGCQQQSSTSPDFDNQIVLLLLLFSC